VDDVLSGEINPELVKTLKDLGGRPVGFAGRNIFKCRKLWLDDRENPGRKIDIGFVGEVVEVNTAPLKECIWCGFTPVISPTALGQDGKIYNCNADVAAAQVAIALKAKRLVFMSDVPGLLRDPQKPGSIIPHLQTSEVDGLKKSGVIDKGMIRKRTVPWRPSDPAWKRFVCGWRVPHAVLLEIFTTKASGRKSFCSSPAKRHESAHLFRGFQSRLTLAATQLMNLRFAIDAARPIAA